MCPKIVSKCLLAIAEKKLRTDNAFYMCPSSDNRTDSKIQVPLCSLKKK